MTETEKQFREELQELLDRYKDQLTNPQIMRIAQSIFTKTIGIRDNPERLERIFNNAVHGLVREHIQQITNSGPSLMEKYNLQGKLKYPAQMTAEADCDGDIKKCGKVCYEGEFKCID